MSTGNRTVLAQQAMDASDVIHMTFAKRVVGNDPPRRLRVQVPDGPSTGGGERARQSIVLAPQEGSGGAAVMCGWLDVASRRAELRTYDAVATQFRQRFEKDFDVEAAQYEELLVDLERTLGNLQIEARTTSVVRDPRASVEVVQQTRGSGKLALVLALGVALGVAVAVVWLR